MQFLVELPWSLIILVMVLGLCIGSFLNVVIYRLPLMMQREWAAECKNIEQEEFPDLPERFNLATPTSACPNCGNGIKPWQNIPVFSYLLLRGRCKHCATPISVRYPLVEFFTAVISLLVIWQFGLTEQAAVVLIFSWLLISMALIDADTMLLPDSLTLPLLWLGLAVNSLGAFVPLVEAVWGAIIGYLCLWSVYWLFKLATGKEGMGYGDFKLLAALGAWLGWQALPMVILISALCGVIYGLTQMALSRHERSQPMPFGPWLAAAGWITMLWQEPISNTYLRLSGLQ
ncbi:MAG: A24 family peptidase [Pseudomonadales bacterium]